MDEENPEDYVLQYYTVVGDQNIFLQKAQHDEIVQYDEDELQEEEENQIMYITVNEDNDEEVVNTTGCDSNALLSVNDSLGVIYPTVSNMFVTTEDGQIYLTQNVLTDGSLIPCQSDEVTDCETQENDEEQLGLDTNITTDFQDDDNSADICQGTNYQEIQLEDGTCAIIDSDLLKSIIEKSNNFSVNRSTHDSTTEEPKTKKWSKKWVCEYVGCGKVYSTSHHLSVHKRVHTGNRPFKCTHCVKTFTTGYSLKSHLRIHTGEKPYPCKVCPKQFKTSGDLQKHNRIHTGEKPFMCPVEGCGKSFTTSNIRKVHIRSHTGERPYVCSTCKKGFSSATNHKNHIRIHSGEKPYVCNVIGCGKRFTEYSSLYKHNYVHQQARPFNCAYCPMSFKQESSLKTHKIGEHDVVFGDDGSEMIYSKFGLTLKFEPKDEDNENEDEDDMEAF